MAAGQLVGMAPFFPYSHIITFLNWCVSCQRIPCPAYSLLCWYTGTSRGDFSCVIRNVTRPDWFCKYKRLPKWWSIPVSYAYKNKKGGQERENKALCTRWKSRKPELICGSNNIFVSYSSFLKDGTSLIERCSGQICFPLPAGKLP